MERERESLCVCVGFLHGCTLTQSHKKVTFHNPVCSSKRSHSEADVNECSTQLCKTLPKVHLCIFYYIYIHMLLIFPPFYLTIT